MTERTSSPADGQHPCPNGCGASYPTARGARQHATRYCKTGGKHPCPNGCGASYDTARGAKQHGSRYCDAGDPDVVWPAAIDPDARWRPDDPGGQPVCTYTLRGNTCGKSGPHYCEPRADRVVLFFSTFLLHTKGPKVRQRFVLEPWQEHEIIRPLFGEVVFDDEHDTYVRRYRQAFIVIARKNGKSELAAGILLYLLVADDEEAAEVYGAAKDTKQAGKVFEPAKRMTQLQPKLNGFSKGAGGRLGFNKNSRRLFDEQTSSYYEVITADALGELGHNPHGFVLDEVLSQPDGSLWEAMITAVGSRLQELLAAITTETNKPYSFGAELIDEAERVQEDPARAPHKFVFVRKHPKDDKALARLQRLFGAHPDLPVSTDRFDPRNWKWPNPALDSFKSRAAMERQALDAQTDPAKRSGFEQFQLNIRRQNVSRWIDLDLYDANAGVVIADPAAIRRRMARVRSRCHAGLDLSSKLDLTAWALYWPESGAVAWRYWAPESVVAKLDKATEGKFSQWAEAGWIRLTDGDTIDYDAVYDDIESDVEQFIIADCTYDFWSGEPVRQEVEKRTGLDMFESKTTYQRMTTPMKEFERLHAKKDLQHFGNPVSRWMADNLEVKSPTDDPDRIRPVKPDRNQSGKRIDGMPALFFAIEGALVPEETSVYESRGVAL